MPIIYCIMPLFVFFIKNGIEKQTIADAIAKRIPETKGINGHNKYMANVKFGLLLNRSIVKLIIMTYIKANIIRNS